MKICIYNTYLNTMGGGEKHMGALAEYLTQFSDIEVDILTHAQANLLELSKKLRIDLSRCRLIVQHDIQQDIETYSAQYDLFINTTHYSKLKPRAKKNALLLFFPILPELRFLATSQRFNRLLHRFDATESIRLLTGFYHQEKIGAYFSRRFGQWTQKTFSFQLRAYQVGRQQQIKINTLPLRSGRSLSTLIDHIRCHGELVPFRIRKNTILLTLTPSTAESIITVKLRSDFQPSSSDTRRLGIFITSIRSVFPFTALRHWSMQQLARILKPLRYYNYLDAYDFIMVNSEYTQRWLKKLWNADSSIVYPVIDTEVFYAPSAPKKKMIISVGRFFEGSHNKKHLAMIRTFKKMYLAGDIPDWEYHLCGGTHPEPVHQAYLRRIQNEAIGYPIFVHPDIPFQELRKRYPQALIFWHASGFEENEQRHPDRFEHFGITTVEAMTAGCIPVVIGKAGQLEIVTHGKNGFLWQTMDECMQYTKRVMQMPSSEQQRMSERARERGTQFSRKHCEQQLATAFEPVLTELRKS
ncbi:MAG: glycosyltransferase [Candidatus Kerfeldbacteria bacterium]|nr:glycosyltransferase [Candidatus Kerfeldbacteria bacterium]